MLNDVFLIIAAAGALAGVCALAAAGFRNGDRPGDALVTALVAAAAQADEERPLIIVTVRNAAGTPVIAALRARRAVLPAGVAASCTVRVARWTARRRFRPPRYATLGVVPAAGAAAFTLPVPVRARRCLLIVAVGQEGGRLRVHQLRLGPVSFTTTGQDDLIMVG
jgi:hypothetical protein